MTTIEYIKIKDLSLLENNPRKITSEQLNKLCSSLEADKDFFNLRPCLVNQTWKTTVTGNTSRDTAIYTVYAGNQRVRAAKKLKWKEVPCIVEENLDEILMQSRIIKDNKTFGEFDWDLLGNDFEFPDLLDWGFTPQELVGHTLEAEALEETSEKKDEKVKCELCGR